MMHLHDSRRQFSASQHIVADTDFLGDEMLANPVIYPFEMPAENDEILGKGKSICHRLIELLTIGGRKE